MSPAALPLVALMVALLSPAAGHANRIILLTDPQASSSDATLMEHALIEVLRENGHDVARLVHRSGSRRARAIRLLAQANTLRRAARAQFDRLELDSALKKYNKAFAKLDRAAAMSDDLRPLKDTLTMLAAINILVGQERRARDLLERLLVLDRSVTVDDAVFNPRMMAVFNAVASRVRGGAAFDLEVHVDPPGAAVIFDGKLVGLAPLTVPAIHPGRHYITASLQGFETVGRAFDIRAQSGHSISLQLTKAPMDSRLREMSSIAVSAIDAPELPPEGAEIAATAGADTVLLLAVTQSEFKLVRYLADGSHRAARSIPERIRDADSVRALAHALLGSLVAGTATQPESSIATSPDEEVSRNHLSAAQVPATGLARTSDPASPDVASPQNEDESEREKPGIGGRLFSDHPGKNATLWIAYSSAAALAAVRGVFWLSRTRRTQRVPPLHHHQ